MRRYTYNQNVILKSYEEGFGLIIPRRYDIGIDSLGNDFEWQITYKFSSNKRPNRFLTAKYGSDNMSYRRLYEILCSLNNGNRFIEEYFKNDYPYREVKRKADKFLYDLKNDIIVEYETLLQGARYKSDDTLDRRQRGLIKRLSEYKVLVDSKIEEAGRQLADEIKKDIERALATGIIHLTPDAYYLASGTIEKRERAGLPDYPRYYASGSFIRDITIYFRLEKKQWQIDHNIMV